MQTSKMVVAIKLIFGKMVVVIKLIFGPLEPQHPDLTTKGWHYHSIVHLKDSEFLQYKHQYNYLVNEALTCAQDDTAAMDARSLASSSNPPEPGAPPASAASESAECGSGGVAECWYWGPAAAAAETEEEDQRPALQSSSFMETRIWNAAAMVSSRCRCPCAASSCRRRAASEAIR